MPGNPAAEVSAPAGSRRGSLTGSGAGSRPTTTAELREVLARLATLDTAVDDRERIEQLGLLEAVKGAAAAAQARVAAAFDASQREIQSAQGVPARERGRGVASQVALARRDSAARGSRHLGLAKALVHELPHTLAHLSAGRISEWRATLVCRETAVLSREHRREVDARLGATLPTMGDRQLCNAVRALAYQLDAESVVRRIRGAESDRRVTVRPAPDAMAQVSGLLPVAQGVAAFAALDARAKELVARGDPRTRGQIMADTLVERVTGQSTAAAVPVEVQLVMPVETLLAEGPEPPVVPGHGPVPAALARDLLLRCADAGAPVWLRRLFTAPDGASLVALDSRRRRFDGLLRRFVTLRDQSCRTPWCDAPIRHADHAGPARLGGRTTADNGQGLCEACNYAKEMPGWTSEVVAGGPRRGSTIGTPHTVRLTTPTGHCYDSTAPPILPGRVAAGTDTELSIAEASTSPLERHLERLLAA